MPTVGGLVMTYYGITRYANGAGPIDRLRSRGWEMLHVIFAIALVMLPRTVGAEPTREHGGLHTPERLANIRRNVERHDWAAAERDRALRNARPWLALSLDELWRMVPGQDLPRAIDVTMTRRPGGLPPIQKGCLGCGLEVNKRFGAYPWLVDVAARPWKIECPNCKAVFPTNDFAAYYASGIDGRGLFSPALADRSLLFNPAHPDPADPLHRWGVDDGFGYVDADGTEYRFVAYYSWQLWRHILSGIEVLADAWVLGGDREAAARAALLLDRLADVYPEMDWQPYADRGWYHSDGGSHLGKIEGRIWECSFFNRLATSYDKLLTGLDGQNELYDFLAAAAERHGMAGRKGSRELLVGNIDDNLLRVGAEAIRAGRISGNVGMHHAAMTAAAVALNSEPESGQWLDWLYEPRGGELPGIIMGRIDTDGIGDEASPGYSLGWIANLANTANRLASYAGPGRRDLYAEFPRFTAGFRAAWRLALLDMATINIGDTGRTGSIGLLRQPGANLIAEAFRHTGDERLALAAWWANGTRSEGLGRSLMDKDPDELARRIEQVVTARGEEAARPPAPHMLAAYGLARLEYGRGAEGTGAYMYFGRNGGHGHRDRLNIGLFGFGMDLAPELGYPEFATAWPHRNEWSITTLSKNTVMVDEQSQQVNWGGEPVFFKELPGLQAVEVSSPSVYPQATEYRRMLALVETAPGRAYAVDIFRVAGGGHHMRGFHGPGDQARVTGLELTAQPTGTLAGPDVAHGPHPEGADFPEGYSWLARVERSTAPQADWQIEWEARGEGAAAGAPTPHVRLWDFTEGLDEVVLASGQPPRNKPGNPEWLRYALACRRGEPGLESTFVALLDPYRDQPQVLRARRLVVPGADPHDGPVVLAVELADGTSDTLIYLPPGQALAGEAMSSDGRLGFVRRRAGRVERAGLIGGSRLEVNSDLLEADSAGWSGTVTRLSGPEEPTSRLWVDAALPEGDRLAGEWITIANDGERNACYQIESIRREGAGSIIELGDVSLVRGHLDRRDYTRGLRMNLEPGATFAILNHAAYEAPSGE